MNSNGRNTLHVPDISSRDEPSDCLDSSLNDSTIDNNNENWHSSSNPRTTILLSLLYLALLTFFGSAVLLAEMHRHSQQTYNVHGFLTILMLTSSAWMLWFGWTSAKNKKIKMYQDHQAGASWLKGGLCLFALATLVLDCLTLGYYHELQQCTPIVVTSFPIVQAIFTVIQVSVLSFYAKVCIQEKQSLNRFGLMHTLATNILMWMSVVLDESMKQLEEIYDIQKKKMNLIESKLEKEYGGRYKANIVLCVVLYRMQTVMVAALAVFSWILFEAPGHNTNSCVCTTDLCHIFSEGAGYLHPFNIEFSLFSSTMLYVIWKNTGKTSCLGGVSGHTKSTLHINGAFIGLILGAFAISATFGVMISFGVLAKSPTTVPEALRIYYLFNSVLLSAMFIASVIGIVTCRLQRGFLFDNKSKSVVRSLDITLLMGSSCGPLLVSVFSLVAIFFLHIEGNLYVLDLCFSLCKTIQVLGQNLFITEALYSEPAQTKTAMSTDDRVFFICDDTEIESTQNGTGTVSTVCDSKQAISKSEISQRKTKDLLDQCIDTPKNFLIRSFVPDPSYTRQIVKEKGKESFYRTRRILQNISILLICYNISVWILYAYGTRPHLVSQIEQSFYGFTLWVIVVKISLPLGIFYRMHSVASLFEAYCNICDSAAY